jgi:hypothetical protein
MTYQKFVRAFLSISNAFLLSEALSARSIGHHGHVERDAMVVGADRQGRGGMQVSALPEIAARGSRDGFRRGGRDHVAALGFRPKANFEPRTPFSDAVADHGH